MNVYPPNPRSIPVGKMRHRVSVVTVAETSRDSFNQPTLGETVGDPVWGLVTPITGREPWLAGHAQPDATHHVVLRGQGVTLAERGKLRFEGRTLNLITVLSPLVIDGRVECLVREAK